MKNQLPSFMTFIKGHVHITDKNTNEVLLNKYNAVHNKNMAVAIARGLSHNSNGFIHKLKLGNGGSSIDGINQITFQSPNVVGSSADLYSPTYEEVIDSSVAGTPPENSVSWQENLDPATSAIIICSATVSASEPQGQDITDSPGNPDPEAQYAFDELGLFTIDNKLLTHIVFSPILKTQNRELVITYTLTVSVS